MSYVLNNGPRAVAPETRARVEEAVSHFGYRPNAVARALKLRRTATIGLLVPDNSNPYFAELAVAVDKISFEQGYSMFLGDSGGDGEREDERLRAFADRLVDGLIVARVDGPSDPTLTGAGDLPVVVLDRVPAGPDRPTVVIDNCGASRDATAHLLEHGHADVGCLAAPTEFAFADARIRGWVEAHDAVGRPPPEHQVVHAPVTRYGGYHGALSLLGRADRPTAVFVHSDVQAVGLLRACGELGLTVPEEVAVIAFDGTQESEFTSPPLAVVRQPIEQIARRAVETLLEVIRGESKGDPTHVVLPHAVVPRRSCGCVASDPVTTDG